MENKEMIEHLSKVLEAERLVKSILLLAKEKLEVFEAKTFLDFKKENVGGLKKRTEKEIDAEVLLRLADSEESTRYREAQIAYLEAQAEVEVARGMVAFALKGGGING